MDSKKNNDNNDKTANDDFLLKEFSKNDNV